MRLRKSLFHIRSCQIGISFAYFERRNIHLFLCNVIVVIWRIWDDFYVLRRCYRNPINGNWGWCPNFKDGDTWRWNRSWIAIGCPTVVTTGNTYSCKSGDISSSCMTRRKLMVLFLDPNDMYFNYLYKHYHIRRSAYLIPKSKCLISYLGGGFGAGIFFTPELGAFWVCAPLGDITEVRFPAMRFGDVLGIGAVIWAEMFLTGRLPAAGRIWLTFNVFSPFKNLGSRFRGTLVNGQLIPSILGN